MERGLELVEQILERVGRVVMKEAVPQAGAPRRRDAEDRLRRTGVERTAGKKLARITIERLTEIALARKAAQPTGRGLMVVKDQLVAQEWAKQGIRLSPGRAAGFAVNPAAHAMGRAAGDRVDLGAQGRMGGHGAARRLGN